MNAAWRMFLAFIVASSSVAMLRGDPPGSEANATYRLRREFTGVGTGYSVALSADGNRFTLARSVEVASKANNYFDIWDAEAGKKLREIRSRDGFHLPFALSPDGRLLAAAGLGRNVSIWDIATGKEIREFHGAGGAVLAVSFSPDGKLLAETSRDSVNIWDIGTGKKVREFEEDGSFCGVAFSPEGQNLVAGAIGADQPIYAWSLPTGKPLARYTGIAIPEVPTGGKICRLTVGFTANGDRIFLGGRDATAAGLWEADTGRLLFHSTNSPNSKQDAMIWPDGRTVLIAQDDAIVLRDVFTGKERERLAPSSKNLWLAFADNGRSLISCDVDNVYVWDFAPVTSAKNAKLTGPELDSLWSELRTTHPRSASRAVAKLVAAPDSALPFLRKHAKPVPRLDPKRIAQLVRDLDNDKFPVRQKAMGELEKYGPMVDEPLRQVLAKKPPLEVRRRIEQIRERQVSPYPTSDGDLLRTLRAIEVLEKIGTAEARRILETLAGGAVNARPTEEAKAALRRLSRKAG